MNHDFDYSADNTGCNRCDRPLDDAVNHHLDNGGPAQCPHCGLGFDIHPDYLADNGYSAGDSRLTD